MARIPMTSGFQMLPEGSTILKCIDQSYDENFGKLELKFENVDGIKQTEQYRLLDDKGKPNDGAMNAFSFMAKNLMNDFDMPDVDPADLVNHYIKCNIEYSKVPSKTDPNRELTFAHIRNPEPATGFDGETAAEETESSGDFDLASLLGE